MYRFVLILVVATLFVTRPLEGQTTNAVAKYDSDGNLVASGIAEVGGQVGIGTTSPSGNVMLDVRNGSTGSTVVQLAGNGLATGQLIVDVGSDFTVKNVANGRLFFGTSNTTQMTILPD